MGVHVFSGFSKTWRSPIFRCLDPSNRNLWHSVNSGAAIVCRYQFVPSGYLEAAFEQNFIKIIGHDLEKFVILCFYSYNNYV